MNKTSRNVPMLLTAIAFSAIGLHSVRHASAQQVGLTREQIVRELGIGKPRPQLTPEQLRAGYLAFTRGDSAEKTIALTFDDGPHGPVTDRLLDVLRQYDVPATFFVVGKMAEKFPQNVRREAWEGHLVENHTFTHPCLDALSESQVETEYRTCSDTILRLTGRAPKYCRPPGGDFDDKVLRASTNLDLTTTLWTDDPGDYLKLSAATIESKVLAVARPGGIILLHDGMPQTIQALPVIVKTLRARGFRFVNVQELEREAIQLNARRKAASKGLEALAHGDSRHQPIRRS